MEQERKDLQQEWKKRIRQKVKENRKKIIGPLWRATGRMLLVELILLVFSVVVSVVSGQFGQIEQFIDFVSIVYKCCAFGYMGAVMVPALVSYQKRYSAFVNREWLKFFLQKWTQDQNEKLGELTEKYKVDNGAAAILEFKGWLKEEVEKMMAIE